MPAKVYGFKPPERPAFPDHVHFSGDNAMLSPPEAKAIIDFCESQPLQFGTVGNGGSGTPPPVLNKDYRSVETCVVPPDPFPWLYDRIADRVKRTNDDLFRFNLTGLAEPVGYLKYTPAAEGKPAGHYDWHQDFGGGQFAWRKLSLVIQLSDPREYTGCELHLCTAGPWVVPYKGLGEAILFPSWTPHAVGDITRGVRRALVAWIAGPQFS